MFQAIKYGVVVIYIKEVPPVNYNNPLITWYFEITWVVQIRITCSTSLAQNPAFPPFSKKDILLFFRTA